VRWLWFQGRREPCNLRTKASLVTLKVFQQKTRAGRIRRALSRVYLGIVSFLYQERKENIKEF